MSSYSILSNINANKLKTTSLITDKIILENKNIYEEFTVSMDDVKNKYDIIYPQLINLTNIVTSNNNNKNISTDTNIALIDNIYSYIDSLLLYTEPDTSNIEKKDKHKELHDKLDESDLLILQIQDTLKNTADIDSLNSSNQQIITINDQLTKLASTTDVEKTKTDIENIKTEMLSLADDEDIQTVNQKMDKINKQLTKLNNDNMNILLQEIMSIKTELYTLASTTYVQDLINDLDIDTLTTSINNIETDIENINSNYDLLKNGNRVSIGLNAGKINQGQYCIAIGDGAGYENQKKGSISIGHMTNNNLNDYSISLGSHTNNTSNPFSIAIGLSSECNIGNNSIIIGNHNILSAELKTAIRKPNSVIIGTDSDALNNFNRGINLPTTFEPGGLYLPTMKSKTPSEAGVLSAFSGFVKYDEYTKELYYIS